MEGEDGAAEDDGERVDVDAGDAEGEGGGGCGGGCGEGLAEGEEEVACAAGGIAGVERRV
jgi:hypothetical protein